MSTSTTGAIGSPAFDAYRLSDEHLALRRVARDLAEAKMAPHAAEVDERSVFPVAAYDALREADLHAVHVPAAYGGNGADALATCIVIEEVARVCASTSLIPAVNKLGSMPLLLAGSEDIRPQEAGRPDACQAGPSYRPWPPAPRRGRRRQLGRIGRTCTPRASSSWRTAATATHSAMSRPQPLARRWARESCQRSRHVRRQRARARAAR